MRPSRHVATVLAYAAIPLLLVVGGVALAVAEGALPQAGATPASKAASSATPEAVSRTPSPSPIQPSPTGTKGQATSPTAEPSASPTARSKPTVTPMAPSTFVTSTGQPTTTSQPPAAAQPTASAGAPTGSPQANACGRTRGWTAWYRVRPGDSLFHVALRFRTSVWELRQANCKSSSNVVVGERLWVPSNKGLQWGFPFRPMFHPSWWGRLRWPKPFGLWPDR